MHALILCKNLVTGILLIIFCIFRHTLKTLTFFQICIFLHIRFSEILILTLTLRLRRKCHWTDIQQVFFVNSYSISMERKSSLPFHKPSYSVYDNSCSLIWNISLVSHTIFSNIYHTFFYMNSTCPILSFKIKFCKTVAMTLLHNNYKYW